MPLARKTSIFGAPRHSLENEADLLMRLRAGAVVPAKLPESVTYGASVPTSLPHIARFEALMPDFDWMCRPPEPQFALLDHVLSQPLAASRLITGDLARAVAAPRGE